MKIKIALMLCMVSTIINAVEVSGKTAVRIVEELAALLVKIRQMPLVQGYNRADYEKVLVDKIREHASNPEIAQDAKQALLLELSQKGIVLTQVQRKKS